MNEEQENDPIVFSLNISDFESVLGRKLLDSEIHTIESKFCIDSWAEYVECFLDCRGIYK